jgi:hypothetical protein
MWGANLSIQSGGFLLFSPPNPQEGPDLSHDFGRVNGLDEVASALKI